MTGGRHDREQINLATKAGNQAIRVLFAVRSDVVPNLCHVANGGRGKYDAKRH